MTLNQLKGVYQIYFTRFQLSDCISIVPMFPGNVMHLFALHIKCVDGNNTSSIVSFSSSLFVLFLKNLLWYASLT